MVEVFETKLRKIGNSLGIIVPSYIIEGLGFRKGDILHIIIPPSEGAKKNKLLTGLAGIDVLPDDLQSSVSVPKKKSTFERDKEDRY